MTTNAKNIAGKTKSHRKLTARLVETKELINNHAPLPYKNVRNIDSTRRNMKVLNINQRVLLLLDGQQASGQGPRLSVLD